MDSVTVEREIDASPEEVRDAVLDVEEFTRAAGFDRVEVEGNHLRVANQVGPKTIELELETFDDPDAILAYRQVEGIFDEMETRYSVEPTESGALVRAETEFALDFAVVGSILDSTVIKRQRRNELKAQMKYLEER